MTLSPEFQEFYDSLGPTELDQISEQTLDQAIASAAVWRRRGLGAALIVQKATLDLTREVLGDGG